MHRAATPPWRIITRHKMSAAPQCGNPASKPEPHLSHVGRLPLSSLRPSKSLAPNQVLKSYRVKFILLGHCRNFCIILKRSHSSLLCRHQVGQHSAWLFAFAMASRSPWPPVLSSHDFSPRPECYLQRWTSHPSRCSAVALALAHFLRNQRHLGPNAFWNLHLSCTPHRHPRVQDTPGKGT